MHLILDCTPSYNSFQDSGIAFLAKQPLLMYINMQLKGFLPDILENEARQRGSCKRRADSLEPFNDGSWDMVFRAEIQHKPVGEVKGTETEETMV